jgi:hypothetical protein
MFQRDSTPGSSISGLPPSASIRRSMARTRCGELRPR